MHSYMYRLFVFCWCCLIAVWSWSLSCIFTNMLVRLGPPHFFRKRTGKRHSTPVSRFRKLTGVNPSELPLGHAQRDVCVVFSSLLILCFALCNPRPQFTTHGQGFSTMQRCFRLETFMKVSKPFRVHWLAIPVF